MQKNAQDWSKQENNFKKIEVWFWTTHCLLWLQQNLYVPCWSLREFFLPQLCPVCFLFLPAAVGSPLGLHFSRLDKPSACCYSIIRSSPHHQYLSWGAPNWTWHFWHRTISPELLAILMPDRQGIFAASVHHWLAFSLSCLKTPKIFSVKLVLAGQFSACTVAWAYCFPAGFCTCLCWTLWGFCQLIYPFFWHPSQWPYLSVYHGCSLVWYYLKRRQHLFICLFIYLSKQKPYSFWLKIENVKGVQERV